MTRSRDWHGVELPNDWEWQLVDANCHFQSSEFNTTTIYGNPSLSYADVCQVLIQHVSSFNEWGKKMSAVHVCDRCGAIVAEKALATLALRLSPNDVADPLALCPDCVSGIHAFLSAEVSPEQAAYKQPFRPATSPDENAKAQEALVAAVIEVLNRKELGR